MRKTFEAKVGEVIEFANGEMGMVIYDNDDELGVSGEDNWFPLKCLNHNGVYRINDAVLAEAIKVYSRSNNQFGHKISKIDRVIVWKRKNAPKELTLQEVIDELGYEIKIVK